MNRNYNHASKESINNFLYFRDNETTEIRAYYFNPKYINRKVHEHYHKMIKMDFIENPKTGNAEIIHHETEGSLTEKEMIDVIKCLLKP